MNAARGERVFVILYSFKRCSSQTTCNFRQCWK